MCDQCGNTTCTCRRPTPVECGRSEVAPKTGVRYYLCEWATGCNMPIRTNPAPSGGTLCRWHKEAARSGEHAFAAFESWLANMQHQYPSRGVWSWEANRLWPITTGTRHAL